MKTNAAYPAKLLVLALALACGARPSFAADTNPPDRMTYQGYVVDGNGVALGTNAPKNYDVIFRIWNDQSNGARLWTEQQTITVDKGYFSVLLGEGSDYSGEPRPSLATLFSAPDASDRFIEITVRGIGAGGSDATILPRLRLLSSPYAFLARNAVFANSLVNNGNGQVVSIAGNNVGVNKASPAVPLDVNGTVAATGLAVSGNASATTLSVANNATVGGTLQVSGAVTTGALTVNGAINAPNRTVTAGTFVGNGTIPVGGIIMWSGTTPPAGWALCDGTQGTPNLAGRFVVGHGHNTAANPPLTARVVGQSGGEEMHRLTPQEMPSHNHAVTLANNGWPDGYEDRVPNYYLMHPTAGNQYAYGTDSRGGDAPHNNMPPFYVLAFIMRIQ